MSSIDLQSGFRKEPVVIRVNEKEVFSSPAVTTQLLIGIAEQIKLPQTDGPARIEIELVGRGISNFIDVDQAGEFFVGVNVEQGAIQFIHSNRPFGYG